MCLLPLCYSFFAVLLGLSYVNLSLPVHKDTLFQCRMMFVIIGRFASARRHTAQTRRISLGGFGFALAIFFALRPTNFYLCNKMNTLSFLSFTITICITLSSSSSSWPLPLTSSTSSFAYSINGNANYQRKNHQSDSLT